VMVIPVCTSRRCYTPNTPAHIRLRRLRVDFPSTRCAPPMPIVDRTLLQISVSAYLRFYAHRHTCDTSATVRASLSSHTTPLNIHTAHARVRRRNSLRATRAAPHSRRERQARSGQLACSVSSIFILSPLTRRGASARISVVCPRLHARQPPTCSSFWPSSRPSSTTPCAL
jgi:hypothetical protein